MTYWTLVDDPLHAIPEIEPLLNAEFDRWPDIVDLPHVVFGDVLNPFVIELLSDPTAHGEILQRIFAFFEEMATSEDDNVVGVLMATVLFRLDAPDILPQQIPFMGQHVKVALELHRKQEKQIMSAECCVRLSPDHRVRGFRHTQSVTLMQLRPRELLIRFAKFCQSRWTQDTSRFQRRPVTCTPNFGHLFGSPPAR